ncbi:MAG: helix-turn-helix domain-containing protein [Coxiellaceae bacterium]|nr:helix-turn-helix domain-containing protein [Coxiellaceae bacterium]
MTTKKTKKNLQLLEKISGKKLTLANLLWSIRVGDEMSQAAFAKLLGVSRQFVCDVEHNRRWLSPAMAAKFAKLLDQSEKQFIRLTLQDTLDRAGLPFHVELQAA